MAKEDRGWRCRVVEGLGRARDERGEADQSATRVLGIIAAVAGQLHHRCRLGLCCKLVCARFESASRHDGIALRESGHDGAGCALRYCGEVRFSRSCCHRDGW